MYAKVQLLFIRCRQLENVIRFLSHIIIYILTACQILFWSKFNQRHKHVYSLGINHLSKWQNIKFISTKKHVNTIWYGKYIDKVTHWDTSLTLSPVSGFEIFCSIYSYVKIILPHFGHTQPMTIMVWTSLYLIEFKLS